MGVPLPLTLGAALRPFPPPPTHSGPGATRAARIWARWSGMKPEAPPDEQAASLCAGT